MFGSKKSVTVDQVVEALTELTQAQISEKSLKILEPVLKESGLSSTVSEYQKLELLINAMFAVTNAVSQSVADDELCKMILNKYHEAIYNSAFVFEAEKYIFEERTTKRYKQYYEDLAVEDGSQAMFKLGKHMVEFYADRDMSPNDLPFALSMAEFYATKVSNFREFIKETFSDFTVTV